MDRLLTIDEVATALRTTPATVRYWRHLGTGPTALKVGRRVLYREQDVTAWVGSKAEPQVTS